jgi:hypothetical protein
MLPRRARRPGKLHREFPLQRARAEAMTGEQDMPLDFGPALHLAMGSQEPRIGRLRHQRRCDRRDRRVGFQRLGPQPGERCWRSTSGPSRRARTTTSTSPASLPDNLGGTLTFTKIKGDPHPRRRREPRRPAGRAGAGERLRRAVQRRRRSGPGRARRLPRPGQPDANGWTVTAATADLLRVTNGSGAGSATTRSRSSAPKPRHPFKFINRAASGGLFPRRKRRG